MTVRSSVKYRARQIAVMLTRRECLTEFTTGFADVEFELDEDLVNSALVTACAQGKDVRQPGRT